MVLSLMLYLGIIFSPCVKWLVVGPVPRVAQGENSLMVCNGKATFVI